MKLLFDQKLSFKLCTRLADVFPDSSQARLLGLEHDVCKRLRLPGWTGTSALLSCGKPYGQHESMVTQIGAHEARTRLAELLKRVEAGERFTIIKRGQAVAELVPPAAVPRAAPARHAVQAMRCFRPVRGVSTPQLLAMIDAGRR